MAEPDLNAEGVTSSEARLWKQWDLLKRSIFTATVTFLSDCDFDKPDEFIGQTLPLLARHFDGKALDVLKKANPWLAVFEPSSTASWERAKSAFIEDGPASLEILDEFMNLIRYDCQIGLLITWDSFTHPRLLLAIRDIQKDIKETYHIEGSKKLNERVARLSTEITKAISDALREEHITSGRIDALLRYDINARQGSHLCDKECLSHLTYEWIFQVLWEVIIEKLEPVLDGHGGLESNSLTVEDMRFYVHRVILRMSHCVEMLDSTIWVDYTRKVQTFVRQVGCAKIHDRPGENIAELRLFHSTTIGYFAKLQDQYLKKELEVKKLRHHISALEFRYLLENLTPPCQPNTSWSDPNSGPRWMKFWEEALKDEDDNNTKQQKNASDHALKSIVDARNPKRGYGNSQIGTRMIHKTGQNGFLYRTGNDLFSILSDEIHRFPGKQYLIEDDDGWTKLVTDTLRALSRLKANMDDVTAEVDWVAERERYFLPDMTTLACLAELPSL